MGAGRWLSVVATGPNLYHLQCGSNMHNQMGAAMDRVHGSTPSLGMQAGVEPAGCPDSKVNMRDPETSAKVCSRLFDAKHLISHICLSI